MCTSGTFHAHISMVHVPVEAVTRKVWPAQVGHGTGTESPRTPKLTSAFLPPLHSQTDVMILFSQIVKLKNLWISSNSLPCQNLKCFHYPYGPYGPCVSLPNCPACFTSSCLAVHSTHLYEAKMNTEKSAQKIKTSSEHSFI